MEYIQAFQFEAEKLRFRNFINDHELPCESIGEEPIFVEDRQVYLVTCKPEGQYFMRFDYETKEWKLVYIITDQF